MFYQALLQVVVDAHSPADASDGLNELLREADPEFLVDWSLLGGDRFVIPLVGLCPDTYAEGDAFINDVGTPQPPSDDARGSKPA